MDLFAVIGWPVLDRLGPVSPHGLGIALGYLAGSWWMLREGRKRGLNEDHVGTILLWALIGAIVGARFFYVIGHLEDFDSFVDMLKIWEGGISLIGGIAGGVGFAYPLMRRFGYRFLQVMDSAALGLAVGVFIGRIGDLIIGDHLGEPTKFPLGWQYKGGELPGPWSGTEATGWIAPLEGNLVQQITVNNATLCKATPDGFGCSEVLLQGPGVHQTALYDFVIALGLFFLLRWLSRRPRREGIMIMTFGILYGAGRVATDFLRVDKTYFGLTGSQLTSIGVILISLYILWRFSRRPLPEPEPVQIPETSGREILGSSEVERPSTEFARPPEPGPGPSSSDSPEPEAGRSEPTSEDSPDAETGWSDVASDPPEPDTAPPERAQP